MKILVALSGGVDSSVVCALLQSSGHEVHAGFMINYLSDKPNCTTRMDLEVAKSVAEHLRIPFYTFDYIQEYEERIVSLIYDGYKNGLTPNPDIWCNNLVKFDLFAQEARLSGYDMIATGHYAQIEDDACGRKLLKRGKDPGKDQSYFLSRLSQEQLSYTLFPIGHISKREVRELAHFYNLPNAERKDSQGLCFIGQVSMQDFLSERLKDNPGDITTETGEIVGSHKGLWRYTLGQRKGIEIGGGAALYVIKKDYQRNILIVGEKNAVSRYKKELTIQDVNYILPRDQIDAIISQGKSIEGEIRYHQSPQEVLSVKEIGHGKYRVIFAQGQVGCAPGQALVLYREDEILMSGIIYDDQAGEYSDKTE